MLKQTAMVFFQNPIFISIYLYVFEAFSFFFFFFFFVLDLFYKVLLLKRFIPFEIIIFKLC